TPHGQIHLRRLDGGGATPILLLHQASGSSRTMAPLMPAFAGSRPCLAPDLPGNGDSFAPADPDGADIAWYAARIDEALTAIGTGRVVAYGFHAGASVALELALARPDRVAALVLDSLGLYPPETRETMADAYAPRIER